MQTFVCIFLKKPAAAVFTAAASNGGKERNHVFAQTERIQFGAIRIKCVL
jgi:hypothetical protein